MIKKIIIYTLPIFVLGCNFTPGEEERPPSGDFKEKKKEVAAKKEEAKVYNRGTKDKRVNPFITAGEAEKFKREYRQVIKDMNLSAVFYSPPRSYAVIDGYVVKENSSLSDKQIVAIEPERVILKDAQQEYIIYLQ